MGVDFFPCDGCGESICDCGSYTRCGCGRRWCDDDCAVKTDHYDSETDTCKFCRDEDVEDYILQPFLLKKLGWTREEAVAKFLEEYTPEEDDGEEAEEE